MALTLAISGSGRNLRMHVDEWVFIKKAERPDVETDQSILQSGMVRNGMRKWVSRKVVDLILEVDKGYL
jgi:hypothetical protein